MLQVTIGPNSVSIGDQLSVSFQRTLRVPDDGRHYPLPPGLGAMPVHRVEDYSERVPRYWREAGGIFIAMYQREALWLGFDGAYWKPNAVKVGVGKVNAISGNRWEEKLHDNPQDYIVCPDQPWLDGINSSSGVIRQFVAMPLGMGYTVEAQVSRLEDFGGIQLLVYDSKPGRFPDHPPLERPGTREATLFTSELPLEAMGLGAGGKIGQKIYPDRYGIDTWDQNNYASLYVHIANSVQYRQLTGCEPPSTPVSVQTYIDYGLPWFELYDEAEGTVAAPEALREVRSVNELEAARGGIADPNGEVSIRDGGLPIRKIHNRPPADVGEQ